MERLTIPDEKIEGGTRRTVIDARAVREEAMTIYWALKKYEDTGLESSQIAEIDRLYAEQCKEVARLKEYLDFWKQSAGDTKNQLENALASVKEYQQKLAEGRMVELPCKVGDTVFIIFNDSGELFLTEGWEVTEITIVKNDIIFDFDCFQTEHEEQRGIDSFGKTVFITLEEAEQALKESEG